MPELGLEPRSSGSSAHVLIDLFFAHQDETAPPTRINLHLAGRVTSRWWPQSRWEQQQKGLKVQKSLISIMKGLGGGAGGTKSKGSF